MQNSVGPIQGFESWLAPLCTYAEIPKIYSNLNRNFEYETTVNNITLLQNTNGVQKRKISSLNHMNCLNNEKILKNDNIAIFSTSSYSHEKEEYELIILRQPEEQHRARYLSEGSRGAIKDKSGTSYCTIQLKGYYCPTRVEIFVASGNGPIVPHPLYRLIPVIGKTANITQCQKIVKKNGLECLEIVLRPENSMIAVLDCMGILKICSYDAKQRKSNRKHDRKNSTNNNLIQNTVRIVFRAYIPLMQQLNNGEIEDDLNFFIIKNESEPIRCVQQLGIPEVMKMSINLSPANGGSDLFIIGRNFDRNAKVLFREYRKDGKLGWSAEAQIDKQFLHQCHIVCKVPPYHSLHRLATVSITVLCASKSSHPHNFTYTPILAEEEDEWRPPNSPRPNLFEETFAYPQYSEGSNNEYFNKKNKIENDNKTYDDDFSNNYFEYEAQNEMRLIPLINNSHQIPSTNNYGSASMSLINSHISTNDLDICFGPPEI